MSENKTAYINAYMQTLAGEGIVLTPRLVEIFSGVLSRQLEEDAEGNITQKTNFETLAKVFTFIATPADERPATPNAYTAEQIAAAQEAAEQAVSPVEPDTFTLAEALALGDDLPDTYHIVDALVTDPVTSDVEGLEDAVADAAENYVYTTAEQAIIDGAETVDISFTVPYILADTLANLAAAEEGVLAGAESYSLTETEFAVEEAVESDVAGLGAALAEAVTGFFTAAEQAVIDGASNGDDVTIDVPYVLADTLENLAAADAEILAGAESYSLTETEFTVDEAVESDVAGLEDAIAAAVDGYFTEAEQAIIDGATNGDEVVVTVASYALVDTLANIQGADAGVLDGAESYTIEDSADNLVAATNVQQVLILAGAEAINVTGDATVAQMDSLINDSGYTNIGTYTLRDTAANLLAEENADIVAGAEEAFVEGEPTLTIAEYDEIAAVATVETWNIEDTAENILAAGAENAALAGAGEIFATDVADLDQAFELDGLGLDVGYDPYESTLEEALDAENLPNNYTIEPATLYDAGELTVAEAEEQLAEAEGILEGAQNADDLVLANLFGYNLADTLENLAAASEDILDGAGQYALTDEAGPLGEISGDEYQLILGAANEADYTYTVEPATIESITVDEVSVTEGGDMVFTVTLSHAVNEPRTIEYKIEGQATDVLNPAEPMDDFGFTFGQFDVPADATEVNFTLTPLSDGVTEGPEGFKVTLLDDGLNPLPNGVIDGLIVRDEPGAGRNINLTVDPDNIAPGAGNDVIEGTISGDTAGGDPVAGTFSTLDSINPGASSYDILKINDASTIVDVNTDIPGLNIMNVNEIQIRSAVNFTMDTTDFDGTELLKVTQAGILALTAADTTDITTTGTKDTIDLNGGKDITVTDATADKNITIGANAAGDAPVGTINVTDSKQGTGDIAIDGGTDVTVTASAVTTGKIDIGQDGTNPVPTGEINVMSTGAKYTNTTADTTLGAITIDGGTSVTVNQTASSDSSAAAARTVGINGGNKTITQSDVIITGTNDTTEVSVTQSAAVTVGNATAAVTGVQEQQEVTFGAMTAGETVIINGLTFTAKKALTAEKVAEAFANLPAGAVQGFAPASDGIYSGTFNAALANGVGMTTGPVSGTKVVFTEGTASTTAFNLAGTIGGTAANAPVAAAKTTGVTAVDAVTGKMGVDGGDVDITDGSDNTNTITTVSLDGYGAGSSFTGDGLTTLMLANSAQDLTVTNTVATTLDLTVNGLLAGSVLDDANDTYTSVNITATGATSDLDLDAQGVTALMVTGDQMLDLATGGVTDLAALETVTVTGTAGLNIGAESDVASLESIDTTGTTGTVTATIMGDKATYTGGAGVDNVSVSNSDTAISKAIDLGDGNDLLDLSADATIVPTATLNGGLGTDTIKLQAGAAETLSGNTNFQDKISGFERLSLTAVATNTQNTIDLDMMDDIDHVTSAGTTDAAQIVNVAVTNTGATPAADDTVSIKVDGVTYTYTAVGGNDIDDMLDGLALLLAAAANIAAADWDTTTAGELYIEGGAGVALSVSNYLADLNAGTSVAAAGDIVTANSSLTLDNMADDGTVVLTGAGTGVTVNMTDASGDNDTLNIMTAGAGNLGTVTVADVETIGISAHGADILYLSADAAETVNITGDGDLDLRLLDSNEVNLIDASTDFSGVLTAASHDGGGTTIKGGSGDDELTANGNQDKLYGGDGDDELSVAGGNLVELWGGEGNDTFDIGTTVSNVNAYATIMDLNAGDIIKFSAGAANFKATAIVLGGTAGFTDLANEAIATSDAGDVLWFEHGGDTYLIENVSDDPTVFDATQDIIVKVAGVYDLSNSSFSSSADTALVIA